MKIVPIKALKDNYIWGLIDANTITVVDPGEAVGVLNYVRSHQLTLTAILLTHHHHDHIGGVEELLHSYPNALVYGPEDSRIPFKMIHSPDFEILPWQFRILTTPGHTSSHICFYEVNQHWLFCGDTLFSAGCGRVFDGTMEALYHSLNQIKQLPDDTKIYCGHEYTVHNLQFALTVEPDNSTAQTYLHHIITNDIHCTLPSTLALEKQINPFLRCNDSLENNFLKFKKLREDKNNF